MYKEMLLNKLLIFRLLVQKLLHVEIGVGKLDVIVDLLTLTGNMT